MHDTLLPDIAAFPSFFTPTFLSSLRSPFFSKGVHSASTRRILGAGGLLSRRLFSDFLLGFALVGDLAGHCGPRADPSMALFVARVMLETSGVNGVCLWAKNADAGTASKSEQHV